MLLRPEDVAFRASAGGAVTVRRCDFDGAGYLVTLDAAGEEVAARQAEKAEVAAAGCLRMVTDISVS